MPTQNRQEPFKRISPQEARKMIERGDVALIDVRQPGEYRSGHIAGSKLIPHDSLFERIDEVPEDKDIVFYCAVGQRSALACEIGAAMGRTRCYNIEGGIEAWKAVKLPVQIGEPATHS